MRNELLIAAQKKEEPSWGDLRITIPVLLLGSLTIGFAFAGALVGT